MIFADETKNQALSFFIYIHKSKNRHNYIYLGYWSFSMKDVRPKEKFRRFGYRHDRGSKNASSARSGLRTRLP